MMHPALILELANPITAAMRQAADQAIMPRFRRLSHQDVEQKSKDEVVTLADREAEAILEPILAGLIDGSRVVGEEAAHANPDLLRGLDQGLVWLVDPLDGTGNFVAGKGPFAVMVALLAVGETIASWIFDPAGGSVFSAVKGHGAFANGKAIARSDPQRLNERARDLRGAILARFLPPDVRSRVEQGRALIGETTPGLVCAGAEYPAALNSQDFALFWRTLPWDHASGALFLTEAGGHVARTDGSEYRPGDGKSGLLAAKNCACWQTIREALLD